MAIYNYIKDPSSGQISNIIEREGVNCLSVITQDYKEFLNKYVNFENPIYGIEMAQNFSDITSSENVHNGNDNTYWTATRITGHPRSFDFSSTEESYSGDQSIKIAERTTSNDMFQLANDTIINSNTYNQLSGWVYVSQDWSDIDRVEIFFYNTNTGSNASEVVNLTNYINNNDFQIWQNFNIPIIDFGFIQDYDAIRWRIVINSGSTPIFYLDDIELQELSKDPATFTLRPPEGTWWHIIGLGITIISDYDSTTTDGTMPNIPYNGILGTSLINGLTYQRKEEGNIVLSLVIYDLVDLISEHDSKIADYGYDGNNTWLKISSRFDIPVILKSELNDELILNINDDLSALERFRIKASIKEEKRSGKIYDSRDR